MKLYLSSYRLGNHTDRLKKLVGKPNAKVAISVNALDNIPPDVRENIILKRELRGILEVRPL